MSQSAKDTKQKIFDAAIETFANKGFWKTKVSDIVKKAGVAQGTFYLYFDSKESCLYELLKYLYNDMIQEIESLLSIEKPDIYLLSSKFLERIYKYRDLSKVFLFEAVSSGEKFRKLYFDFKEDFKKILTKVFKETEDCEVLVSLFSGFLRELMEYYIIHLNEDFEKTLVILENGINRILRGDR